MCIVCKILVAKSTITIHNTTKHSANLVHLGEMYNTIWAICGLCCLLWSVFYDWTSTPYMGLAGRLRGLPHNYRRKCRIKPTWSDLGTSTLLIALGVDSLKCLCPHASEATLKDVDNVNQYHITTKHNANFVINFRDEVYFILFGLILVSSWVILNPTTKFYFALSVQKSHDWLQLCIALMNYFSIQVRYPVVSNVTPTIHHVVHTNLSMFSLLSGSSFFSSFPGPETLLLQLYPREQSSWGQHGTHLGPVGPRWAPCGRHEPSCYLKYFVLEIRFNVSCHRCTDELTICNDTHPAPPYTTVYLTK